MRTFYDYRDVDYKNPQKYPLQGRVILKSKKWWLLWIYKDSNHMMSQFIEGFIVTPRTIYLYNVYLGTSFWDAFKYFIKKSWFNK